MEQIVRQQLEIADYQYARATDPSVVPTAHNNPAKDLGTHLYNCHKVDLEAMEQAGIYAPHVALGTKHYTETMPAVSILKLAKNMSPNRTLWDGFLSGFEAGLPVALPDKGNPAMSNAELAKLIVSAAKYPDMKFLLQKHLTAQDTFVTVRIVDDVPQVTIQRLDGAPDIFNIKGAWAEPVLPEKTGVSAEFDSARAHMRNAIDAARTSSQPGSADIKTGESFPAYIAK